MSSIVSRRPPFSGSVSQSKDLRWISMRLGTSRTLFRRAKLRRVRGAWAVAKAATPRERSKAAGGERSKARPAKIAQGIAAPVEGVQRSRTPSRASPRMWRGRRGWDGCDYRLEDGECRAKSQFGQVGEAVHRATTAR